MTTTYDALNPVDHAASMIESCQGNAQEALHLAHINVDFARGEDQHYWDRVAIAIQQIISTRPQPPLPPECASSLGTGLGQLAPATAIAQNAIPPALPCLSAKELCFVADRTECTEENGLVPAAFMEHGVLLRVTTGHPAEFAFSNRLLASLGSCRRWLVLSDPS